MESYNKAFGEVLKKFRLARNLTQEDLALEAEIDRSHLSLLERGLRTPSLNVLMAIIDTLSVHPAVFFAELKERQKHVREEEKRNASHRT